MYYYFVILVLGLSWMNICEGATANPLINSTVFQCYSCSDTETTAANKCSGNNHTNYKIQSVSTDTTDKLCKVMIRGDVVVIRQLANADLCSDDVLKRNVDNDIKKVLTVTSGEPVAKCCNWTLCNQDALTAFMPNPPKSSGAIRHSATMLLAPFLIISLRFD